MNHRPILVPYMKYKQAKDYQEYVKKSGLKLPLWCCLTESERQNSMMNGDKQRFRRLL